MAFFHCIVIAQGPPINMVNDFLPQSQAKVMNRILLIIVGSSTAFVAKTS